VLPQEIIRIKRDGGRLDDILIDQFVEGIASGRWPMASSGRSPWPSTCSAWTSAAAAAVAAAYRLGSRAASANPMVAGRLTT
jgi:hypothetical protein